jgi:hypothetical protein
VRARLAVGYLATIGVGQVGAPTQGASSRGAAAHVKSPNLAGNGLGDRGRGGARNGLAGPCPSADAPLVGFRRVVRFRLLCLWHRDAGSCLGLCHPSCAVPSTIQRSSMAQRTPRGGGGVGACRFAGRRRNRRHVSSEYRDAQRTLTCERRARRQGEAGCTAGKWASKSARIAFGEPLGGRGHLREITRAL